MSDSLAIIRRVIDEHRTIGRQMKLAGESVTDDEALAALEKARADWIPGRPESTSTKHGRLQQAIGYVEEGLKNHFAFEEDVFPALLGELLARAIAMQHREILTAIDEIESAMSEARLDKLGREELLAEESRLQQRIGMISQLVDDHARKEELILDMVQRVLEQDG